MKNLIEILEAWAKSLNNNISHDVVSNAIAQNKWFSTEEIHLAIRAICDEMLYRERLNEWFSHYNLATSIARSPKERVLIVMAGNIPLVGFFDMLCVVAAGHTALIKPSHKDRVLIEWAILELREIEPSIPIFIFDEGEQIDRLIATGSDTTRQHFECQYPNIPTLLRGTRHSLAVIGETDSDSEIEALREDIFSYSGLGCRNVSMIFAPKGFDLNRLPKGTSHPKHRNNYQRTKALLSMIGSQYVDIGSHCIIESDTFPREISQLSIYQYESLREVETWITRHNQEIQCIVASSKTINHPRQIVFGRAQHPSLFDYADGVDTMKFLLNQ